MPVLSSLDPGQRIAFRASGAESSAEEPSHSLFGCRYLVELRDTHSNSGTSAGTRSMLSAYPSSGCSSNHSGCNFFLISLIIEADIFFFDILCRKSFHFTIYIVRHIPVFVTCQHIWICNINCRNFFAFLYFLRKSEIYGNQIFFAVAIGIYRCFNIYFFYDIRFSRFILFISFLCFSFFQKFHPDAYKNNT